MKMARIAVIGVALVAGLGAALLARNLTAPAKAPVVVAAEPAPVDTVDVLVAERDLSMDRRSIPAPSAGRRGQRTASRPPM